MVEKKRIAFYSILSSGHLNVCATLGTLLLDNHFDEVEIYFIVDKIWSEKLAKIDPRFKFGVFEYDNPQDESRMENIVHKLESCLKMSLIDKAIFTWKMFIEDESLFEVDKKSEIEIEKIKPHFLICDQGWHLPAMVNSGVPYAFLCSCNPLIYCFDGFPKFGSDAGVEEKEKIEEFTSRFAPSKLEFGNRILDFLRKRGAKYFNSEIPVEQALSNHFNIYCYPSEVDYFSQEMKQKYQLWQIDTPLCKNRVPKPYELPDSFKNLPGKIIYVSLGSLFSAYTYLLQRLINTLDKLPHKYIVSKGLNGDKIKFPSDKFIGENYIDQLGVLQIADMMIAHGGNNTFGECFYFGVPCIILPIIADQINNAKRIEETGYGYSLDIMNYKEDELIDKISKILTNEELKKKWKGASERIQKEKRIDTVVAKIVDYISKL